MVKSDGKDAQNFKYNEELEMYEIDTENIDFSLNDENVGFPVSKISIQS